MISIFYSSNCTYINIISCILASLNLKQTLKIIKRFKFEELELGVFPIFPELLWDEIKLQLIKNHKSLTTNNILPIIEEEIIVISIICVFYNASISP